MPDPTTIERLRGLVLSANDLKSLTEWPDALIEDYLNIVDNLIIIANLLDVEIDANTVLADAVIANNAIVRGDGGVRNVQDSLVTIDDTGNVALPALATVDGIDVSVHAANADAHHPRVHTIVSHDTTATGAELDTLTDDSMADALHRHSELSASDGDPDACLSLGATGAVTLTAGARVVKEVKLTIESFAPGASGAAQTLIGHYSGWAFTINDDMVTSFEVPFDWDSSSNLDVKIYWYIDEAYITNSGEVQWEVHWAATPSDNTEALDAPTHTGIIDFGDQDIPATAKYLTKSAAGVIAAASIAAGDLIGINVFRIGLDGGVNPAAEPVIVHFEVEYTANKLGEAL